MADLAYRVILEPEPDGSAYNAIIPAFPHAHTFGATVEEAMANSREIIELELDLARERDEEIPVSDAELTITPNATGGTCLRIVHEMTDARFDQLAGGREQQQPAPHARRLTRRV